MNLQIPGECFSSEQRRCWLVESQSGCMLLLRRSAEGCMITLHRGLTLEAARAGGLLRCSEELRDGPGTLRDGVAAGGREFWAGARHEPARGGVGHGSRGRGDAGGPKRPQLVALAGRNSVHLTPRLPKRSPPRTPAPARTSEHQR